jgi:hypothetical protein
MTIWLRLYNQIRAIEIVHGLNERGTRVARYIEKRMRRSMEAHYAPRA